MAKVTYINPIAFLRGKIGKKEPIVYKRLNTANKDGENTNFTQVYVKPEPHALSAAETETRTRFKAISARVRTAYSTESTLRSYKAQFAVQSTYKSLRKFIWEAEAALYDAEP